MRRNSKFQIILISSILMGAALVLSRSHAQMQVLSKYPEPLQIKPEFPKPEFTVTPWTAFAEMDMNTPIVILVNKSGREVRASLEVYKKESPGLMAHTIGPLPNGQQRLIVPYIRRGGTVRVLYTIGSGGGRFYIKEPLQPGVPMVITFHPSGFPKVNLPYTAPAFAGAN